MSKFLRPCGFLLMIALVARVQSWSVSRRKILANTVAGLSILPSAAQAACLQGDLRPVCIGIYKIPMDDAYANYISTPEQLEKFAPDLLWVAPPESPKSFEEAMEILVSQRVESNKIQQSVAEGNLEAAGVAVLGLIPKITASGRFVMEDLERTLRANVEKGYETATELAIDRANQQLSLLNGFFGECDIVIGQGLRGELGVTAVAQLTILSTLRDANGALDDFLVTAKVLGSGEKLPEPPKETTEEGPSKESKKRFFLF